MDRRATIPCFWCPTTNSYLCRRMRKKVEKTSNYTGDYTRQSNVVGAVPPGVLAPIENTADLSPGLSISPFASKRAGHKGETGKSWWNTKIPADNRKVPSRTGKLPLQQENSRWENRKVPTEKQETRRLNNKVPAEKTEISRQAASRNIKIAESRKFPLKQENSSRHSGKNSPRATGNLTLEKIFLLRNKKHNAETRNFPLRNRNKVGA